MAKLPTEEVEQLLKPVDLSPLSPRPLVSLLTPNYNYGHYVGEAIESALAQTYTNFEMIVCDDGSTDNSCETVEGYARRDPRIRLIRKQNGGVASALNAAYRESKGEIICLLDADDRYTSEKLDKVVGAFQARADSGFLVHRVFHIDAAGSRCGITPFLLDHPSGWYGPSVVHNGDVPPALLTGAALCLRRAVGDSVFPLPEKFKSLLDGVITAQATLMTPLIWLELPLGEYRHHGTNLTNTTQITAESWSRAVESSRSIWEVRRDYLRRVHPRLAEIFPPFEQRSGGKMGSYIQARLQPGWSWRSYRSLVRSESFSTIPWPAQVFWRISILLPSPLFRRAMNLVLRPNRLKQFIWKMREATRGRTRRAVDVPAQSPAR
jgi:hypothetical protein